MVTLYFLYVLVNYVLSLIFSIMFFNLNIGLTKAIAEYYIFSIKYLIVAIGFAVVIPFCFKFIRKNVKIKLEENKD